MLPTAFSREAGHAESAGGGGAGGGGGGARGSGWMRCAQLERAYGSPVCSWQGPDLDLLAPARTCHLFKRWWAKLKAVGLAEWLRACN